MAFGRTKLHTRARMLRIITERSYARTLRCLGHFAAAGGCSAVAGGSSARTRDGRSRFHPPCAYMRAPDSTTVIVIGPADFEQRRLRRGALSGRLLVGELAQVLDSLPSQMPVVTRFGSPLRHQP